MARARARRARAGRAKANEYDKIACMCCELDQSFLVTERDLSYACTTLHEAVLHAMITTVAQL